MFTRRRPRFRPPAESPRLTADIAARIERLRALSVHDEDLARLLDEIEPCFQPEPDPSPRPVAGQKTGPG